jgi:hypothetical protein
MLSCPREAGHGSADPNMLRHTRVVFGWVPLAVAGLAFVVVYISVVFVARGRVTSSADQILAGGVWMARGFWSRLAAKLLYDARIAAMLYALGVALALLVFLAATVAGDKSAVWLVLSVAVVVESIWGVKQTTHRPWLWPLRGDRRASGGGHEN